MGDPYTRRCKRAMEDLIQSVRYEGPIKKILNTIGAMKDLELTQKEQVRG